MCKLSTCFETTFNRILEISLHYYVHLYIYIFNVKDLVTSSDGNLTNKKNCLKNVFATIITSCVYNGLQLNIEFT